MPGETDTAVRRAREGSLQQLTYTTLFYERQLTAIEALTDWCRENATRPPPANLLYAAAGAAENLRKRLVPIKEQSNDRV